MNYTELNVNISTINLPTKQVYVMQNIEEIAKQYCIDMSVTLEDTLKRFCLPDYEEIFKIFIEDTNKGNYFLHFNYRLVNGDISIQPRTNVGLAITDYTDRVQGLK